MVHPVNAAKAGSGKNLETNIEARGQILKPDMSGGGT